MIHKQSSFGCDVDFVKFFIVLVAVKMLMMLVYEINEGLSSLHHDKKNLSHLFGLFQFSGNVRQGSQQTCHSFHKTIIVC